MIHSPIVGGRKRLPHERDSDIRSLRWKVKTTRAYSRGMSPDPRHLLAEEELDKLERALMQQVGTRIRHIRLSKGWTQGELAPYVGGANSSVAQTEAGDEVLTAATVTRYAVAFEIEPYELCLEQHSDEPPKPPRRKAALPPLLEPTALSARINAFRAQIGRRIYDLRTIQGMTLAFLAEFAAVDIAGLRRVETGKGDFNLRSMVKVAEAIGVLPYELYLPRDQSSIRAKKTRPSAARRKKSGS